MKREITLPIQIEETVTIVPNTFGTMHDQRMRMSVAPRAAAAVT